MLVSPDTDLQRRAQPKNRPLVLVADDHLLVRDAMVSVLSTNGEFDVSVAASFTEVVQQIAENGPFDITLLDINMPGMEGIKSIADIVSEPAAGKVVMVSGNAHQDFVFQGMKLGAHGYISKGMKLGALVPVIKLVASGEKFVASTAIASTENNMSLPSNMGADKTGLTKPERDILILVANGLQNKEVAWKSGFSEVRVKMYMRSICKKLNVTNRTGAALKARELGLI